MDTLVYVLLAVAALAVAWAILTLNSFVRARNKVDEAWSGIDAPLPASGAADGLGVVVALPPGEPVAWDDAIELGVAG